MALNEQGNGILMKNQESPQDLTQMAQSLSLSNCLMNGYFQIFY
jgi:hypothetical protein